MKLRIKNGLCYLIALFFLSAGLLHFIKDDAFAAIVPPLLPFPYAIVWITGVIEIILAILLLCPHFRKTIVILFALYLLAVLPANIYMATANIPFNDMLSGPFILWTRVALQFPFIVLILWAGGAFEKPIKGRKVNSCNYDEGRLF